jgi:hypothetical protein
MNKDLLAKHVKHYLDSYASEAEKRNAERADRREREAYYQSWTAARLAKMTPEDLLDYLSRLFAMMIWGNKRRGECAGTRYPSMAGLKPFLYFRESTVRRLALPGLLHVLTRPGARPHCAYNTATDCIHVMGYISYR